MRCLAVDTPESADERAAMRKKTHDLTDLLSRVTPGNLHAEQDIGESRGREMWWRDDESGTEDTSPGAPSRR